MSDRICRIADSAKSESDFAKSVRFCKIIDLLTDRISIISEFAKSPSNLQNRISILQNQISILQNQISILQNGISILQNRYTYSEESKSDFAKWHTAESKSDFAKWHTNSAKSVYRFCKILRFCRIGIPFCKIGIPILQNQYAILKNSKPILQIRVILQIHCKKNRNYFAK